MAKRSDYKMTIEESKLRRFSENFKREKVREIDFKEDKNYKLLNWKEQWVRSKFEEMEVI